MGETQEAPPGYTYTGYRNYFENSEGEGLWATKASMPTARTDLVVAAVNGKIYAIGGSPYSGCTTGANEEYTLTTEKGLYISIKACKMESCIPD